MQTKFCLENWINRNLVSLGLSTSLRFAGVQKHFIFGNVGSVALRRRPLRIELAQSLLTQPLVAFVFLCLIRSFKQA
jgi:hypothetical protein